MNKKKQASKKPGKNKNKAIKKMQVRKKALHELSHFQLIFNLKILYTRDKTGSMKHALDEKKNERSETVERIWREQKEPYHGKMDQCSAIFSQRMNNSTMCQVTPSSEYMRVAAALRQQIPNYE